MDKIQVLDVINLTLYNLLLATRCIPLVHAKRARLPAGRGRQHTACVNLLLYRQLICLLFVDIPFVNNNMLMSLLMLLKMGHKLENMNFRFVKFSAVSFLLDC